MRTSTSDRTIWRRSTNAALWSLSISRATPRAGIPRASEKLRFDQFFTTPPAGDAVETPSATETASEPVTGAGEDLPPEDDDLDQFQGWLRGLTQ